MDKYSFDDLLKEDDDNSVTDKPEEVGFLKLLFGDSTNQDQKRGHGGACDGDCANCPSHYGYRYGRWYYGHDHTHGCEFGGNRGGGGII